jgi:hypothetical protein
MFCLRKIRSAAPIFPSFAPHGLRFGGFDFRPVQHLDRPERYGEPIHFDRMPSQPEFARLAKYNRAVILMVLVQPLVQQFSNENESGVDDRVPITV